MAVVEYTEWDLCCGGLDPTTKTCVTTDCGGTVEYQDWLLPAGSIIGEEQDGVFGQGGIVCCGSGSNAGIGSGVGSGGIPVKFRDVLVPSCYVRPVGAYCVTDPTGCCVSEITVPCCPGTYPSVLYFVFQNANYTGGPPGAHCRYENQVVPLTWNGFEWTYHAEYTTTIFGRPRVHSFDVFLVPCLLLQDKFFLGVNFSIDDPIVGVLTANSSCANTIAIPGNPPVCANWPCPTRPVFLTFSGVKLYYHDTGHVGVTDDCVFPTAFPTVPYLYPSWTFDAVIIE